MEDPESPMSEVPPSPTGGDEDISLTITADEAPSFANELEQVVPEEYERAQFELDRRRLLTNVPSTIAIDPEKNIAIQKDEDEGDVIPAIVEAMKDLTPQTDSPGEIHIATLANILADNQETAKLLAEILTDEGLMAKNARQLFLLALKNIAKNNSAVYTLLDDHSHESRSGVAEIADLALDAKKRFMLLEVLLCNFTLLPDGADENTPERDALSAIFEFLELLAVSPVGAVAPNMPTLKYLVEKHTECVKEKETSD